MPQPAKNVHLMITISKVGVLKPKTCLAVTQQL